MNVLGLVLVLVVLGLVVVPLVLPVVAALRRASRVANSPRLQAEATVINKRTEVVASSRGEAGQRYYATFQFPDGERLELMVSGLQSGMLAVGDQGTLDWQGTRYLGFAREILR